MNTRFLVMIFTGLFAVAGCAQIDQPVATSSAAAATVQSPATAARTDLSTTDSGQSAPTVMPVTEETGSGQTDVTAGPAEAPAQTPIPCNGRLTSRNQEGPYYRPGSPQKDSLIEAGMPGEPTLIFGRVFDQDCHPIAGARLDFWQADADGVYDNMGYRLRGHLFTDPNGAYALETIAPGPYTGRPAHVHVKVFAPDGRELLTTQMYFAGSESSPDVAAAPDLLVTYLESDTEGRQQVLFSFVVED